MTHVRRVGQEGGRSDSHRRLPGEEVFLDDPNVLEPQHGHVRTGDDGCRRIEVDCVDRDLRMRARHLKRETPAAASGIDRHCRARDNRGLTHVLHHGHRGEELTDPPALDLGTAGYQQLPERITTAKNRRPYPLDLRADRGRAGPRDQDLLGGGQRASSV